jgi:hypothetical protein
MTTTPAEDCVARVQALADCLDRVRADRGACRQLLGVVLLSALEDPDEDGGALIMIGPDVMSSIILAVGEALNTEVHRPGGARGVPRALDRQPSA